MWRLLLRMLWRGPQPETEVTRCCESDEPASPRAERWNGDNDPIIEPVAADLFVNGRFVRRTRLMTQLQSESCKA